MRKLLVVVAMGMLVAGFGCKNGNNGDNGNMHGSNQPKKMSADACSHCPGNQTATADGKCPQCGMKVGG